MRSKSSTLNELRYLGADIRFVTTVEKNLNALRLVEIARRVGAQFTGKLSVAGLTTS